MTVGQQRAVSELQRLCNASSNTFESVHAPCLVDGKLTVTVALFLGAIVTRDGGLDLREREEFIITIPEGFPFDRPSVAVSHSRFSGFPHVTWGRWICLYQSSIEWNPSDGLYGFFDRLKLWLGQAAINEMDPIDGPLEPPHHATDFTQNPFVIRANAPCEAGESWTGLAVLKRYDNRTELVAWDDLSGDWPTSGCTAFAVILPDGISMEFPRKGAELFRELERAGMSRDLIIRNLALAAFLSADGEPLHLVLGLPMRRAAGGSRRLHIAVWIVNADDTRSLRGVLPKEGDTGELHSLRKEIAKILMSIFELSNVTWCKVFEDRDEVVVRRDNGTPLAWFSGKKVLILGCGALGSWTAEMVARSNPNTIHLVDSGTVKPGILARQNFELKDIGSNKADALAQRLSAIAYGGTIVAYGHEAHGFVMENSENLLNYDVVLDCTASSILQMKLERDWSLLSHNMPSLVSLVIDAQARHCLCAVVHKGSKGGVWDAYLSLKRGLCIGGNSREIVKAFYSERATDKLFQPEPGCSDPTFVGSAADVVGLVSGALNAAVQKIKTVNSSIGIALSAQGGSLEYVKLPHFCETVVGNYRVRILESVFTQARSWVRQSNRRRSLGCETGGLLWGLWDDAIQVIWVFDLSGPPPDSQHNTANFVCGVHGTVEEHKLRFARTHGVCGFVGYWHTHPNISSHQSITDMGAMASLVSSMGQNQNRSAMLIFGRTCGQPTAGIYVYESQSVVGSRELISANNAQIQLEVPVI